MVWVWIRRLWLFWRLVRLRNGLLFIQSTSTRWMIVPRNGDWDFWPAGVAAWWQALWVRSQSA